MNILLVLTNKAASDWSDSKQFDELRTRSRQIKENWLDDVDNDDGEYTLSAVMGAGYSFDTGGHDDSSDALDELVENINDNSTILDRYEGAVVLDSRTYDDGAIGVARVGEAGTDTAVALVADDGDEQTAPHEVGHLFNAQHDDFESTRLKHSIMGKFGNVDCNDNTSYTSAGDWYSDCAVSKIRNYIDYSGNI